MALWLTRAGRHGEHEQDFFANGRILLTFGGLNDIDLSRCKDWDAVRAAVVNAYGEISAAKASHTAGQLWAFTLGMNPGDLVIVPRKASRTIAVGEIAGPGEGYARIRRSPVGR